MLRTRIFPALLLLLVGAAQAREPRLAHWIEGKGNEEKVVLIHGFNSSHATWAELVPRLAKRYQVLVYDQPGHGLSPARGEDYSPRHLAEELKALLEEVEFEKVHVVGHSMGGRTAVQFAALYPDSVASLVVEDMHFLPDAAQKALLPGLRAKYAKVSAGLPSKFASAAQAVKALGEFYTQDEIPWILAAAVVQPDGAVELGNRPEVTSLYLAEGLSLDMSDPLRSVRARLAFFAADPKTDTAVLKDDGLAHARRTRPEALVKVFGGSGHTLHGRPDFAEALLLFLASP